MLAQIYVIIMVSLSQSELMVHITKYKMEFVTELCFGGLLWLMNAL